jgi:hypothetical protein
MDCAADDPSPLSTAFWCSTWRRSPQPLTAQPRGAAAAAAVPAAVAGARAKPPRDARVCLPPFGYQPLWLPAPFGYQEVA